jgi:hypothetical protein
MNLQGKKIQAVKAFNIIEEDAKAIEKMVNEAISKYNQEGKEIIDIKITEDNIFLILGEKH